MIPRVLFMITDSGRGGAENVLTDFLQNHKPSIVEPCGVLILKNKREMARVWEKMGIPVVSFGMKTPFNPFLIFKIQKTVRRFKPHILHTFTTHALLLGRLIHFFNKSFQLVSAPHLNYRVMPKWVQCIMQYTHFLDDRVLCEGIPTRDYLIEHLRFSPEKTKHIANGIQLKKFGFSEKGRSKFRGEINIKKEEILIGSVGRLHPQKGYDILIEALERLNKQSLTTCAVVAGEGPDKEKLQHVAKLKSVPIQFIGVRSDIIDILSSLDIYVQSSRYEGMPISLLEAMSVGCPIIATAVDGTADLSDNNMILVPPDDPNALAEAIKTLLRDENLRLRLAQSAQKSAQKFSVETMVRGYEKIYSRLHSNKKARFL